MATHPGGTRAERGRVGNSLQSGAPSYERQPKPFEIALCPHFNCGIWLVQSQSVSTQAECCGNGSAKFEQEKFPELPSQIASILESFSKALVSIDSNVGISPAKRNFKFFRSTSTSAESCARRVRSTRSISSSGTFAKRPAGRTESCVPDRSIQYVPPRLSKTPSGRASIGFSARNKKLNEPWLS